MRMLLGNSLVVQWLGLCTFPVQGLGLIPSRGTKIPQVTWHSQKKIKCLKREQQIENIWGKSSRNFKKPNLNLLLATIYIGLHRITEKAMAPYSSTLAWKIPWIEEPGRLQSMGSRRVWHNWATSLLLFTFLHWRRKWQPTPVFLPGESQGRGSLVGCRLWGRTESDTTEVTAAAATLTKDIAQLLSSWLTILILSVLGFFLL